MADSAADEENGRYVHKAGLVSVNYSLKELAAGKKKMIPIPATMFKNDASLKHASVHSARVTSKTNKGNVNIAVGFADSEEKDVTTLEASTYTSVGEKCNLIVMAKQSPVQTDELLCGAEASAFSKDFAVDFPEYNKTNLRTHEVYSRPPTADGKKLVELKPSHPAIRRMLADPATKELVVDYAGEQIHEKAMEGYMVFTKDLFDAAVGFVEKDLAKSPDVDLSDIQFYIKADNPADIIAYMTKYGGDTAKAKAEYAYYYNLPRNFSMKVDYTLRVPGVPEST